MDWDGAGGFMNDSIADEPQQLVNSVSVGGDDKNKSIAAVSISQIVKLTRPNEGLVIHGKKVYHLNLVALVHEILDKNPQKIHLLLDDYTSGGPLEVNHIIGDAGTPGEDPSLSMFSDDFDGNQSINCGDKERTLDSLKVGDYVRCIGVVKFSQDKPNFVAYNVRIIEDPNEVTAHILEVIRDSLYYSRLQSGDGVLTAVSGNQDKTGATNFQQQPSNNEFGKLSTRDKHVLKFMKEKAPSHGMNVDAICQHLKAFSKSDIQASLDFLSAEGLCWPSDVDEHWCVNT